MLQLQSWIQPCLVPAHALLIAIALLLVIGVELALIP